MLLEPLMSLVVKASVWHWALDLFEVSIPFWSLGLLSLTSNFYGRGVRIGIAVVLALVIMIYKAFKKILTSVYSMYGLWFLHPTLHPNSSGMFWEFISNYTQSVRGGAKNETFQPSLSLFSFGSVMSLFENVQFPLNVKETIFLVFNLVSFLYMVCSFSRMRAEISRGAGETPDPEADAGVKNPEWGGEWENIGQTLKEFSDPVDWDFPQEQIQNAAEVGKYLKEKCHDDSKEKRLIAISWALAYAYRTLLDTVGQQTEAGGQGDKSAIPVTQAVANSPGSESAARPDSEPKPASKPMAVATSTRSGKRTEKTDRPVDDDDDGDTGEGTSMPPDVKSGVKAAGARSDANIESYSLKDLRGLRKDYTRRSDESIISWLVHLWDAAGKATILDGTEARHLGSLSQDPATDQGMMSGANPHSLWERVLRSVAQRYLCSDDLYMQQTQWKTIEQGIQRLREMAVAEIVFSDDGNIVNPDLVPCTSVMWRKLVRLGPQEYASALAMMKQDDGEETVLDMAKKLRAYADTVNGPTHARIAAVETRLQKLEDKIEEGHKKLREEIKESFLQISAVQIRGSGTQRRRSPDGERRYIPRAELWFYLRDCGEDMRRWHRQPTSALAQRVRQLKIQRGSSKREAAPVASNRTVTYDDNDNIFDPLEGTSKTYAQGKKDNQA
ncbi:KH domain-containing RNA-binding protein QKI isoform X1 [Zonotrichia albicollis]|uniref:KH domain-containing RNA-binding protein QKI isoform X1 n=1 Tax=Zonotrichia albicollis TaxID=44394 RepID=UPI003D80FEA8